MCGGGGVCVCVCLCVCVCVCVCVCLCRLCVGESLGVAPFSFPPSSSNKNRCVLVGSRHVPRPLVEVGIVGPSSLGDLRWVARFEPNLCEPNRSTYRQRLPKVCQQQFHGQS